jgi:DNA-directed RNA polymerase subunit K/omega
MQKRTATPLSTVTRDITALAAPVGNVYETVVIISKRANQISSDIKHELDRKLSDFSSISDSLEEIHENREQIEVSRFYEKMPKATLRAIREFEDGRIYYRNPMQTRS